MKFTSLFLWISIMLTWTSCKTFNSGRHVKNDNIVFIDSTEAARKIIRDDIEGYFSQLTAIDRCIQMKVQIQPGQKPPDLKTFTAFLSSEVSDWSEKEKKLIASTVAEAIRIVKGLTPDWKPRINLIKIKTNHYGNHVYYTRGNNICIPENIFENYNAEVQLPILIHEIFHLISKTNPVLRDQLYALIGFFPLKNQVLLPDNLEEKMLTNPDGVTRQYAIRLRSNQADQDSIWAIPLITSKFSHFKPEMPHFFDYLAFDLYPVVSSDGQWTAQADALGNTTLPPTYTPYFFTKIRDNTQYIIHPEEIMADNFMLAALAKHKNDFSRFSYVGKQLIEQVIKITSQYSFP